MFMIIFSVISAASCYNSDTGTGSGFGNNAKPNIKVSEFNNTEDAAETLRDTSQYGFITGNVFNGKEGSIHYSYYLPESYDGKKPLPMVLTIPGYDMMWFGEESAGKNNSWNGFTEWTKLDEDLIAVTAQLTDWNEKSARQCIELTEYFIDNFNIDKSRIYAAGYSAGGETMSRAVSIRPDLYAAYLHVSSQWDGTFEPIAENDVAVFIFIGENDEYYGSEQAEDAYQSLYEAYSLSGKDNYEIDKVLQLEVAEDEYFNRHGIDNYHAGGSLIFDDKSALNWILEHKKIKE